MKRSLIIEHVRLVSAFVKGDESVKSRLNQIEETLEMTAVQIAHTAVEMYKKDYN